MELKLEPRTRGISPHSVEWERPETQALAKPARGPHFPSENRLGAGGSTAATGWLLGGGRNLPQRRLQSSAAQEGGLAPPPSLFPPCAPSAGGPQLSGGQPTPTLRAGRQTGLEQNQNRTGRNVLQAEQDWRPLLPTTTSQKGGVGGDHRLPPPSTQPAPFCTSQLH